MIKVSRRLQAVCDMVPSGRRICDVGCDHAYVDIRLLQEGRVPSALAMDVAKGPLEKARENLEMTELTDRCELRLSDGLSAYERGEADTMICTGMGGLLVRSILEEGSEKVRTFRELILSPQREPELVREWLRRAGFVLENEVFLEDGGKFYTVMKALPSDDGDPEGRDPSQNISGNILPAANGPDWEELSVGIRSMSEEQAGAAMVSRSKVLTLIGDPSFRSYVENRYGPCILRKFLTAQEEDRSTSETFYRYVTCDLRAKLSLADQLHSLGESGNAAVRRDQIGSSIGILQVLLFLQQMNARHG